MSSESRILQFQNERYEFRYRVGFEFGEDAAAPIFDGTQADVEFSGHCFIGLSLDHQDPHRMGREATAPGGDHERRLPGFDEPAERLPDLRLQRRSALADPPLDHVQQADHHQDMMLSAGKRIN